VKVIAHRGFRKKFPENTIPAFTDAFRIGSDAVELDVHLTKDEKVVVFHDFDLYRFFGIRSNVGDLTLNEIRKFVFPGTKTQIPTLEEVLSTIGGKEIFVELKTVMDDGTICYPGLTERVTEIVLNSVAPDLIRIISFNPLSIARVREISRNIETGLDISESSTELFSIPVFKDFLERNRVDHIFPEYPLLKNKEFFKLRDVKISPWTINDPEQISGMENYFYAVVTDFPDRFLKKSSTYSLK